VQNDSIHHERARLKLFAITARFSVRTKVQNGLSVPVPFIILISFCFLFAARGLHAVESRL
jgi:hypothetical protein